MLPSLGFNEIIILGILALVVVGPKDLPLLFRKLGRWTAKLRAMAHEFRSGFDELARQAELDELKREVEALRRTTGLQEIGQELAKPLPTLEDYAGVPKPAGAAQIAPSEAPSGGDQPEEAQTPTSDAAAPQPSAGDDIAAEQELDVAEEAAPIARRAP